LVFEGGGSWKFGVKQKQAMGMLIWKT